MCHTNKQKMKIHYAWVVAITKAKLQNITRANYDDPAVERVAIKKKSTSTLTE